MANSKVELFGETLIDLTNDTVTPEDLAEGVTAHAADGTVIRGTRSDAPSDNKAYGRLNGEWSTNTTSYGYCQTAADTAAKTVTIPGFSLVTGVTIFVKFQYANSASNPTLNVNGTGAKALYRYGTTRKSTTAGTNGWQAGAVLCLTYDGTGWIETYWNNNTYTIPGAYCTTEAGTAAKAASCTYYSLKPGYFEIVR